MARLHARRVRRDDFSTRLNVASNPTNDGTRTCRLGQLVMDGVVRRGRVKRGREMGSNDCVTFPLRLVRQTFPYQWRRIGIHLGRLPVVGVAFHP